MRKSEDKERKVHGFEDGDQVLLQIGMTTLLVTQVQKSN
jgi:hypothetical protein